MNRIAVTLFVFILAIEGIIGLFDSCIHGGAKYKEGDHFLPNDTIIKTESPRECVQCRCRQGLVLCEIETCPTLACEAPVRNPQFCCLRCPGTVRSAEVASDFVIGPFEAEPNSKKNANKDCFSNGKRLRNGSAWQPVIGPFGVMACVECRCREGVIICGRLECKDSSCPRPRRQLGQCCPVCPSLAENKRKAFCLPKFNELFVFKTPNVRNNSDRIEYAFLENKRKNDMVRIHTWNLHPKNVAHVFTFSVVPRKEFHKRNLRIIGSITKRRYRKYSKREKKLKSNCLAKCFAKIERLENSLVDRTAAWRDACAENETDASEFHGRLYRLPSPLHLH